ncbi:uncharacterized protein BDW43DRAFT_314071 [Aspergillus alliaceus]|uniref:uncharacterized protein n=1 Tax=Petromyces alliaceus TaxID=209559 RepID=UPI0012A499C7|nr:uncharacterized protein BDW43DRAFT_314071 [Aspergillus alliaceus]KAB8230391.1 hypothetical protein BDW43DRAFT_314071 [Aspergillus alliaceus]
MSDYTPDVGKPPQSIAQPLCIHSRLEERFRDPGLQVIFEVSRIDFTPKEPTCSKEPDFHVEGFANEHIVATATHIIEAENITDVQFTFQYEDETHPSEYVCPNPLVMEKFSPSLSLINTREIIGPTTLLALSVQIWPGS